MKKSILITIGLLGCLTAFGQSTNVNRNLFNSKEFAVGLDTGYVLKSGVAFQDPYAVNLAADLSYFFFRNVGASVVVPFYSSKGISFSELQLFGDLRFPLSRTATFWRNLAPFVQCGGVYNWNTDSRFAYIGKAGLEVRVKDGWAVFADYSYRNHSLSNWGAGQKEIEGGLKIIF